jgi:hypothetical protein
MWVTLHSLPLLAAGLIVANVAGCSTASSHSLFVPSAQIRSAVSTPSSRKSQQHAKRNAATLVEESLHARGIRFGTDGSMVALFSFVRGQFPLVQADQARGGDVLFFDLGSGCGTHAGVVETAETSGRIGFREWRDGSSRHSFVSPREPFMRRDDKGRILNTFLRPKRLEDSADTAYFAGEMLCAVFRVD